MELIGPFSSSALATDGEPTYVVLDNGSRRRMCSCSSAEAARVIAEALQEKTSRHRGESPLLKRNELVPMHELERPRCRYSKFQCSQPASDQRSGLCARHERMRRKLKK